ncbi:alanine dehydrogenase [Aureibacter tunicatorum]|uniref:alanine dehydrogenase n=1 Tax=Aureibacter tunicatorum TaxID=866807 RepID=A0AAE3XTB2_9BACT|nr:alanine dehydrogenase [Aureibacter tunicatorum]MDR6242060.1 alanine dehydrogenase [Aureibacter tunicatorum]BDD03635.1 alanine dehydrogenase [Aureibacter tunicatorum]
MNDQPKIDFSESKTTILTKESMMPINLKSQSLRIGVPKENSSDENRVTLTPDAVEILVNNGHEVLVEANAGVCSNYPDNEYSDAGAKICYHSKEVFESQIIVKVAPPTLEELGYMKPEAVIISALQMGNLSLPYLEKLKKKRITALAYELLQDLSGQTPFVRAMSEIAGSIAMLIASEYLSSTPHGKGIMIGSISGVMPSKVVILGSGTVAEHAARAAIGLGAEIKIFDNHIYKLRRLKHAIGLQIPTCTIDSKALSNALKSADVVIGALKPDRGRARYWVTEEMISQMQEGSVIIDIAIDQGGCFETSQPTKLNNPVFIKHGVIHYCVPNIASKVARTATKAISNIFTPILLNIGDRGGIDEMIYSHHGFMNGVYTYKGCLTNPLIASKFNINYKDLELLITARF